MVQKKKKNTINIHQTISIISIEISKKKISLVNRIRLTQWYNALILSMRFRRVRKRNAFTRYWLRIYVFSSYRNSYMLCYIIFVWVFV